MLFNNKKTWIKWIGVFLLLLLLSCSLNIFKGNKNLIALRGELIIKSNIFDKNWHPTERTQQITNWANY